MQMMFESLARLIFDLIQPTSQLVILFLAGVGFLFVGWHAWAKRVFAVLLILVLLYTTPFLSGPLVGSLENRWPVLAGEELETLRQSGPGEAHVIVLGAGHTHDPRLAPGQMLTATVTMRLAEGLRIHRQLPESYLVTSASASTRSSSNYSQAEALRDAAIGLGADPDRIHTQTDPTNTCEEARAFVRDHGEGARVVIATSATHMRRAMMVFRQQGAVPVAAPTDFAKKKDPGRGFALSDYYPSMDHLDNLERVVKEYAGYVWDKRTCQ